MGQIELPCIVRTFVSVTMYPKYSNNKNKIIKRRNLNPQY
jgi:hypothetical protein